MKNYNKILEAINKGIQIALDDYQDIETNNSISNYNDVINSKENIRNQIEFNKKFVDLGLPSGTLWCKYNLGVDPNKLNDAKDWHGDYYAWGELKANKTNKYGKIYFVLDNYKFGIGLNKLTKYCNIPENGLNGFADNLTQLLPEDDAAYQANHRMKMPTKEQCDELLKYTINEWIKNYQRIKGLNGRLFTSKINGEQIFIPSAGYYIGSVLNDAGERCWVWSSSLYLDYPNHAYSLRFSKDVAIPDDDNNRCYGLSVRPVM